jgi:hypothetical protein
VYKVYFYILNEYRIYQVFIFQNPNPCKVLVGDCVVRGIATATGRTWRNVYIDLCTQGLLMCDMPSSNAVWQQYLTDNGYKKNIPQEKTVGEFAEAHEKGIYILCTGEHVVTIVDGNVIDTWDSSGEHIILYFKNGE